jgi:trehalose 6-phosphate phosphatase
MEQHDPARALGLAREALAAGPAGLLTDLDGTLSPIVAEPADAAALPGAAEALAALGRHVAVVGIVSGRGAGDVRRIIGTGDLLVVGNHGLEWLEAGSAEPGAQPGQSAASDAVARALELVPDLTGVAAENKGLSATIHFRNAPDPAAAQRRVREALEAAAPAGVLLRPGRMSLELRPIGAGDKGTAVRAVVERYALRGLVVLGDDVTDLDMFRAAAELREAGRLRAAILGVAGGREVPAEVLDAVDAVLPDPAGVVELLRALASASS